MISKLLSKIEKLIYPPRCCFCGQVIDARSRVEICNDCYVKIPFHQEVRISAKNRKPESYYDRLVCACSYTGIVRQALLKFKFYGKASVFRGLAALLAQKLDKSFDGDEFDIIIPVPLHRKRLRLRGYNQSELISSVISAALGIPLCSKVLRRHKATHTQSLLGKKDRHENVKDAFDVAENSGLTGKRILLVDDILTTGSTINECGRVLKLAGAASVTAAVVAAGKQL